MYTQLEFVDIAGLVKGASNGEGLLGVVVVVIDYIIGLGNRFLANIRQVFNAIEMGVILNRYQLLCNLYAVLRMILLYTSKKLLIL